MNTYNSAIYNCIQMHNGGLTWIAISQDCARHHVEYTLTVVTIGCIVYAQIP